MFVRKFAFDFTEAGMQGLLTHEKALIVNTLGGDEATLPAPALARIAGAADGRRHLEACGVRAVTPPRSIRYRPSRRPSDVPCWRKHATWPQRFSATG